jgi:hypothetical protein
MFLAGCSIVPHVFGSGAAMRNKVALGALACLTALLAEVANRTSAATTVEGATHPLENRGDADATLQSSITDCSTRSVPIVEPTVTRLATPVGQGTGERDVLNGAEGLRQEVCNIPGQTDGGRNYE